MTITSTAPGACPSCESTGPVGAPCGARGCLRQGLHLIPAANAQAHWKVSGVSREALVGQFVGDFLVVGRLGQGGFGRVLEALQRPLFKLKAAVKLLEFAAHDADTMRRVNAKFENEAGVMAVLNHPNIVRLLHYGVHHDRPFLAMEFVPGGMTLRSLMSHLHSAGRALDAKVLRHVFSQMLDGLEAAHRESVIHRDIKPDNIMLHEVVGNPHHVKLLDFGIAKIVEERRDTSVVMGTIQYMAPEQIEGRDIGPWTDLYALGCILFEFVTGRRVFVAEEHQAILLQKLGSDFDPLEGLESDVARMSDEMRQFLRKSLARDPARRHQSTAEFRSELALALAAFGATSVSSTLSASGVGAAGIADSKELTRIRSEMNAIDGARRALESERGQLDAERRDLDAQRTMMESRLLGRATPDSAYEATVAHIDPSLSHTPARSQLAGVQTGFPDLKSTVTSTNDASRSRRRVLFIGAGLALLAGGGALAAFAMGGDAAVPRLDPAPTSPEATRTASFTEDVAPTEPGRPGVVTLASDEPTPPDTVSEADDAIVEVPLDVAPQEAVGEVAPVEAATETSHRLEVESTPPASVFVNGQSLGRTPYTLEWQAGEPRPKARLVVPGYRTLEIDPSEDELAAETVHVRLVRLSKAEPVDDTPKRPIW